MNIFCVTSQFSIGCTFLEWSVHWLAGHNIYYNVKSNDWIELLSNPLIKSTVNNAHGHQKNHPSGLAATQRFIDTVSHMPKNRTYSLYPCKRHIDQCCLELGIDVWQLHEKNLLSQTINYQDQDYNAIISHCVSQNIPVIYVYLDQQSLPYAWNDRSLDTFMTTRRVADHPNELCHEWDQMFCGINKDKWISHTDNIWDLRERMALNIRPFEFLTTEIDEQSCYKIYCRDLWFDTEKTIIDAIAMLGLKLDQRRLSAWLSVVHTWQNIHRENLWFSDNLDRIVNAIVDGSDLLLPELSLRQECIIQHCLIYQRGLNLRTWNLEKFPNNTLELHSLLEPNIHNIDTY